ncbi:MAG: ABC transporter permease [Anaerolineae bacterium]|nr:ABC transporter permease [Anaerolineae bacterium]
MTKFLVRRILQAIPTLFGISIISFLLMDQAPGDPVAAMTFGPDTRVEQVDDLMERYGLNEPVHMRYLRWLLGDKPIEILGVELWEGRRIEGRRDRVIVGDYAGAIRGDFGNSLFTRRPVDGMIAQRLTATAELGVISLLVGFGLGIPLGILAAVWQGSLFDNFTRIAAVFFSAVPNFWLGLILILIFGVQLGILPMGNRCPLTIEGCENVTDRAQHLFLPVLVLSTGTLAVLSRYMRAATLDVLNQDYIRTARAKGLKNGTVWFVHASRNALVPVATIIGPAIPGILGGALITETIFAWPGIGRLAYESVLRQDYPLVMAIVMFGSVLTVLGYLISDILYALVDPRIRLS